MSSNNFQRKSIILTFSNLAIGILGFLFSITLSKALGPEGMGLYGLVRPVYNVFLCISSAGLSIAVSKICAEYFGKGDYYNYKRTIKTSLTFTIIWTVIISSILFIFSPSISKYIIRDVRTAIALKLLSPAIVFISLSSCLKGYFISSFKINVPVIIDILEKALRIILLTAIISRINSADVTITVTAAYITLAIGEFISFIFLYGYYKLDIKSLPFSRTKGESRVQLFYNIVAISFPLLATRLISSILSTFSSLIIPRRLVASGIEYRTALGMIGKFNGMARTVVFFPMVVIESISTLLIPDLSKSISKKDYYSAEERISRVLSISFLLGAATLIILLFFGDDLGLLLYKRNDLGKYIKFAALTAPVSYTASTSTGVLNGLGKQKIILRNSTLVSILRIVLLYILTAIPSINIYGYGIAAIITSSITLFLNLWEISKVCYLRLPFAS